MRALLSVSDKTGLVDLARALVDRGIQIVSTGGTLHTLTARGLPVTHVSEVTGFPEILDGRVKTLHPAIHGGILARRDRPDHLEALARHHIAPLDIVVVNLYPFVSVATSHETSVDGLIDHIDIGGPSLIRAAAKSFAAVLAVVDPVDYPRVVQELDRADGPSPEFRLELARKAFAHTARYDQAISSELMRVDVGPLGYARTVAPAPTALPSEVTLALEKVRDLRYGENPHQAAAWYREASRLGFGRATVLQGKELSFTNLLDLDAAARVVLEFTEPAAAVIKHTNPCGVATGATMAEAYLRARDADPLSAFGGIVGLNQALDEATAQAIASTFIEAVVAPAVSEQALRVLASKKNLRVVTADFSGWADPSGSSLDWRSILGGVLVEVRDRVAEADRWPAAQPDSGPDSSPRVATRRVPTADEWQALRFAWRVCAHVKSNAVIFTAQDRTLAIGAGQMSRVDAVRVAVMKAGGSLAGSVAASDAFFPFSDGLEALAEAGATAVVQPGGSVRDPEVIAAADAHGLAMVFTGRRHFRH